MIMHSEWLSSFTWAINRELAARRIAEAFALAAGARAQVREVAP